MGRQIGLNAAISGYNVTVYDKIPEVCAAVEAGQPKPDCYDLIEQMVKEGRLGRKTGKGFYDYSK